MNESLSVRGWPLGAWARLRELLQTIAALQGIETPLSTPAGLRKAVELLLRLGELLGLEADWLDRLRPILTDDGVLKIVLAVWQFVLGGRQDALTDGSVQLHVSGCEAPIVVTQQSLIDWLPVIVQLINVLRIIRGGAV